MKFSNTQDFPSVFNFQDDSFSHQIRTIEIDGKVWFVGSDVAKALGYVNANKAVRDHCKEKGRTNRSILSSGGNQSMILINESNVYRLIIKSKLPSAERFEEWLMEVVLPSIRETGSYGSSKVMPKFMQRCMLNINNTDSGYFSVIQEMIITVHARFEAGGFTIPDNSLSGTELRPDTSVGICFANYLRDYYPDLTIKRKKYSHEFLSGLTVGAWQYPNEFIAMFREFIDHVWIPQKAHNYFKSKAPEALEYLPMLIPEKVKA